MDPEKITNKFSHLDEYLKLLKQVGSTGKEEFTKDKILIGSANIICRSALKCVWMWPAISLLPSGFVHRRTMLTLFRS